MRPTVLLFDIDGTLITTGGAARAALELAIAEILGVDEFSAAFSFGGMTDRAIMRRSLEQGGAAVDEPAIDAAITHYLSRLDHALGAAPRYQVHPGVRPILDAVTDRPGYAVGLGTGNVERGARIKLDRVGLNPYFDFGGFGCDAESRPALIRRGAERGAERVGAAVEDCRVVVIGDTTRDVHAAHENGFECVAVATGGDTAEVLRATATDWFFDTLADPGADAAVIHGEVR